MLITATAIATLRRLLVITIAFVVIGFIVNVVADNPYSHRLARKIINEKIRNETNLEIDFEAIKVSVFPFSIDLYGLALRSSNRANIDLLKASQVKARLSLSSLFFGDPKIGLLELQDAEFAIPLPVPFDEIFKQAGNSDKNELIAWPPPIEDIPIEDISLRNARVLVNIASDDPDGGSVVSAISGLDLKAELSDPNEVELYLLARNVDLTIDGYKVLESAEFESDIVASPEKIFRSPYRLITEHLNVNGIIAGKFITDQGRYLEGAKLEVGIVGKGDVAQLGTVFDIPETHGIVSATGDAAVTIPLGSKLKPQVEVTLKATSDDAQIRGFKLYQTTADLHLNLERLKIVKSEIIVGKQTLGAVNGTIGFSDAVPIALDASLNQLPLTTLMSALTVDFDTIATNISTDNLRIEGQADPFRLSVNALADFRAVSFPALDQKMTKGSADFPTCRLKVDLGIDSRHLDFGSSAGNCYLAPAASDSANRKLEGASPPSFAKFVSPVSFSGSTSFEQRTGIKLAIAMPKLKLAMVSDLLGVPLGGEGSVLTSIVGPYDNVKVVNDLSLTDAALSEIPIGRTSGTVNIIDNGKTITWNDVRAIFTNNGSLYSKAGSIDIDSLSSNLHVSVVDAPPKLFETASQVFGLPATSMTVHALEANLRGHLQKPLTMTGDLSLFVKDYETKGLAKFDVIEASFVADQQSIRATKLNVELKDFQLAGTGKLLKKPSLPSDSQGSFAELGLSLASEIELDLETYLSPRWQDARSKPTFFVDHLQALPFIKDYAATAGLQGRLALTAAARGRLDNPQATFSAQTSSTKLLGSAMAPIKVEGVLLDKKLDLITSHSGSALDGRISLDLGQEHIPYSWYFKANRLDLRALGSRFFAQDPRNFAYFSGTWSMSGNLTKWWRSQGELSVDDVRARYYRDVRGTPQIVELQDRTPVKILFGPRGWRFEDNEELLLEGDQFRLHVGLGKTKPPEEFNISFDGYLDLALVQSMSQMIDTAKGMVEFEGSINGSVEDPSFKLNVKDKKNASSSITIGFATIQPPFTDIKFDATLSDKKFVIKSLTAKKGGGTVSAAGQTVLNKDSLEESRIDVTLDHATLTYQVALLKSFETELSGSLAIVGNSLPLQVSGDIIVDRARSTREFDLREQIIGALQRRQLDTPLVPDEPLANLDLRIIADKSIEIYNRTIQSVLSADLLIKGSNVVPVVNGQIEVNKGVFAYKYRRDFRITQGLMTFDDPVKPDPGLDILGVSEISGYRVYLAITGRASNPRVDLSVDPPVREDGTPITKLDILVLMSTGALPERTQNNSTASAAQAEALNILVGQFEEPVEKLFDLSGQTVVQRVYIDTYAGEDGPTPRLNLPLNLHRDWDVIFRVDENNQKVSLGYTINDSISVSGSVDSQRESQTSRLNRSEAPENGPDTGVDLKFRFAFP